MRLFGLFILVITTLSWWGTAGAMSIVNDIPLDPITYDLQVRDPIKISGDQIVIAVQQESQDFEGIILYDIPTGAFTNVSTLKTDRWGNVNHCRFPDISGDNVVWVENDHSISRYDISQGRESAVTRVYADMNRSGLDKNPDLDGDNVVFVSEEETQLTSWTPDIMLINLTSGEKRTICSGPWNKQNPDISGDLIVWEDSRNGPEDIYMYDLERDEERAVCTYPGYQRNPTVSGTYIAWEDFRGGDYDIYLHNLSSGKTEAVATGPLDQMSPSLSGQRIAWREGPNPRGFIGKAQSQGKHLTGQILDLSSKERIDVVGEGKDVVSLQISGDRVLYWIDIIGLADTQPEIHIATITPPSIHEQESIPLTNGSVPEPAVSASVQTTPTNKISGRIEVNETVRPPENTLGVHRENQEGGKRGIWEEVLIFIHWLFSSG